MDVNTIQTAISTLGFPIVCVLFLGWFIWKIWMSQQDQNKEREDKLYEYLGKAQAVNEQLTNCPLACPVLSHLNLHFETHFLMETK